MIVKISRFRVVVCTLCVGLGMCYFALGGERENKKETQKYFAEVPELKDHDHDGVDKCLDMYDQQYVNLGDELIEQWNNAKTNNRKFIISSLMGLYRLRDCVQLLSAEITLHADLSRRFDREGAWGEYPAVDALTRIGIPSVPTMLENIEKSKDKLKRQLSASVVFGVYGDDVAFFVLDKAMQGKSDSVKANYKEVIEARKKEKEEIRKMNEDKSSRAYTGALLLRNT